MIHAAVQNRIFDTLDAGPGTIASVAAATGCSVRGVRGLLEALAAMEVLVRDGDRFTLAPDTAAFLVRGKPTYLGGMVDHTAGQLMSTWMTLDESVRTGRPSQAVNRQKGGAEFFENFVEDLFNLNYASAAALAGELAPALADVKPPLTVLDIAAGSGVWSMPLIKLVANAQAVAVDFPEVTAVTRRVYKRHGLESRLRTIEGDIDIVDFGAGHRVAFLGHILHSEGEERSRRLLKKVYRSLAPGGIVAIAEFVPADDRSGPPQPLVFALNMLLHTDEGDTFTFGQMTSWLREAGFVEARQFPIPAPSPILLAKKPV
jgi:ubiquinone/menaquinone biosynthesis C-methylase UbiE